MKIILSDQKVISKIYLFRGKKVMLDRDLAELYNVETKVLNQAVKRNAERFPDDFMFQLNRKEFENWKSQIVTSNSEKMGLRKLPSAFTEQGVAMLSSVLNSKTAIRVNIQIIRIFTRMREMIVTNKDILLKLSELERVVIDHKGRITKGENEMKMIFEVIKKLLGEPKKPIKKVGYKFYD